MKTQVIEEDWEVLKRFLPDGWERKATELGALVRKRKIESADTLLRVLLIHLADGKSLRTTSAYAMEADICDINDVALLHRLKASREWFRWMSIELIGQLNGISLPPDLYNKFRVRLVDSSSISEPGSTGTDWRIHYSFRLNTFKCDFFKITSPKEGDTFKRFPVNENDLLIGDRGYCHRQGIIHILNNKGNVMVRFHSTNLPLFSRTDKPINLLEYLRKLSDGIAGDWDVWFRNPDTDKLVKGRICAIRKSKEAIEKSLKKLRQTASRKGNKLQPETIEYAEYVIIFTTLTRYCFGRESILSSYRGRWQIELVFKRLKSIIEIGHLPKINEDSCISWLYGKMFVALLTERLYQEAEFISPWGYPL